jgi:hypothetical protein
MARDNGIDTSADIGCECRNISDELPVHLSPLGWEHINLTGDYVWHVNRRVTKGHFRPLRQPREAPVRWFEAAQANS